MNALRWIVGILGCACLAIGSVAALSNGTIPAVESFGHSLIIAGAIITAGVLVSFAIIESAKKK